RYGKPEVCVTNWRAAQKLRCVIGKRPMFFLASVCTVSAILLPPMPETGIILVVEDRENDILLMRKAFEKATLNNPMQVVRDGEEAVAYLSGEGRYSNRAEY